MARPRLEVALRAWSGATSLPIVVEAMERIVNGLAPKAGVLAAGEAFDAKDFLRALAPHLSLETP